MDNSDYSRNRSNDYLGVNKIGKNIRKSPPIHQPNFTNPARQPPQPQVYNINKNDFQSIVQQLTGSPSRHQEPHPRPPQMAPRPSNTRMQRSRLSPLTPLNVARPRMPVVHHAPPQHMPVTRPPNNNNNLARPPPPNYGQQRPPSSGGDHTGWSNTAESPISAYMRYLQHSIMDPAQGQNQSQNQSQHPPQSSGLLPYPLVPPHPSPRMNGGGPPLPPLPSPRMNGPPPLPPLPSPTSQFLLPSPSGYLNLLSPRSPYPLLSPGYQHPPPLTPNFSFSPMTQHGAFGPGPGSQPPPSPGMGFPSPGFFSIPSPRWRD